ncbi:ankyrin 2,3/unc44 [Beauveria bassiana ARSEF 2860]|uniref:Ankyrin 2,3/unc44 n=1 Tax=Beauveria bassiana (strain ARSEF 2860) TaxID=655819 RepID=J4W5U4_BEAB2|nr:ankyrin 2,3/unc44 [Beauveria bassiana ARSEF 2860]EJP65720.1 ankyrin 2,3/unc44 [Beauveria bassiana ARSEF 2860]
MPTASLGKLPNDILLVLAEFLSDASINALAQTSRRNYDALDHALYIQNARKGNCSALQWAAYYGMLGTARKALAAGANPNTMRQRNFMPHPYGLRDDIYQSTPLKQVPYTRPLVSTVRMGRVDFASTLIEAGALVDVGREEWAAHIPLISAFDTDSLVMTELLMASGQIDINSHQWLDRGYNLLSFAILHAGIEIVRYLLARMDTPDASSRYLPFPLITAVRELRADLIPTLLASTKIDPNRADEHGRGPLWWAVQKKNKPIIQLLLNSGVVDTNAMDDIGQTAISLAAENGYESLVYVLLATPNVNPVLAGNENMKPIVHALRNGHTSVIKALMTSNRIRADVGTLFWFACKYQNHQMLKELMEFERAEWSATDAQGNTWLHSAVTHGLTDIVKTLISQQHIDINAQRLDGATPLICALQNKRRAITKVLLQANADVNIATNNGRSPLFYAAKSSSETLSIELLKRGSHVGAVTNTGATALHQACEYGMSKVVQLLLKHGADPLHRDGMGDTPLHMACACRWEQIVRILLGVIPRSDRVLSTARTPLHDACRSGHTGIARRLLEHGADPLARLPNGPTPLEYACTGHPLIAKMLLDKGADPLQRSSTGHSLLWRACVNQSPKVAALLLQYGADPNAVETGGTTPFMVACRTGSLSLVRTLLNHGGDVTAVQANGSTAMHELCRRAHGSGLYPVLELMVKKGADINARTQQGLTPLHESCHRGKEIVSALIKAGADAQAEYVDATTSRRKTPIHIVSGNPEIGLDLLALLNSKSRIPVADLETPGWTPLHEAASATHVDAVDWLMEHGMNPMAVDENGRTALHQVFDRSDANWDESCACECISALVESDEVDINHRDNEGKTALGLAGDAPKSLRTLMIKLGAEE